MADPAGRELRDRLLYEHAWSECLAGALLAPVGRVSWQPSRRKRGRRADYLVHHPWGLLVVEVKRIRVGRTTQALIDRKEVEWALHPKDGPLLETAERLECERIYVRPEPESDVAAAAIFGAYPLCALGQIHVGGLPAGPCTIPIGL